MLQRMRKLKIAPVALALAGTLTMSVGQASDKSADKPVVEIPFERFTLDNGLTVIVHEDHKAPIVAVNVWYHVGSKDEKPGKTGFAHLFEHLMFNGTENFNDEYFGPFEKAGATDQNGTTNSDRTNYFENVPTTAVDMALWMESDRMGHLLGAITQPKLDEQRGVVQNEKRQGENQPYGKSWEQIGKATFPMGHPYSWTTIGSMDDLNAAKLDDVHEWFKQYYGAANAVIVLAGDIDVATAKEKVQKYFGDIPAGQPLVKREAWIAKRTESTRDVMFDRVPQTRLIKVWNVPQFGTHDADMLDLFAAVLGGGKNSRLYKTLVYDKQLATSANAFNDQNELASQFMIMVDVKPGADYKEVDRLISEELNKLLSKGIKKDELSRVQASLEAGFIRGVERVGGFGGKSDVLATYQTFLGDANLFQQSLKNYASATEKDLVSVAKTWLSDGDYTLEVHPFPTYSVAKDGADRSKVPEVKTTPDLSFPALQRAELKNGLKVVLAERKAIPVVNFELQFDAGYAADQGGKLGTASFTMAMIDEGTQKRSSLEIADEAERLGANIGAGAGLDTATVSLSALKKNLDASLSLYADIVRNPAFANDELERNRTRWIAGIAREKAQPVQMALRTLPPLLYGAGHAYAIPFTGSGTEASIKSLNRDDLVNFHQNWLRPDNATLIVVGDTTLADVLPKLEKAFGDWKAPSTAKPGKNIATVAYPAKARVYLIDKPGAVQSVIIAGQVMPPTNVDNNPALITMNDVLGGAFSARLNMNLRENKHWAYGAYAQFPGARGQRPYFAYAPVQTDKTADSIKEVLNEYRDYVGKRPATSEELQKSVMNTVRSMPGEYETMGAVQGAVSGIVQYGRPDDYVQSIKPKYESLTVADIQAAAKTNLKPEQFTWIVVGDLSKVEDSIRQLNLGEVTVIDADGNKIR
ncbi:insulinase family protein [Permianibacter sp. IMCC34836]|uniref:M16 family metallopeptidase n=1 Tax=Permianibacter fluminis TaxID=2738515 RepID=UPI001552AD15|nr:pitrilysin family protein [Permianibacter fluminis]NQD38651.1 insulinase family protein [Permianibacter fluminis]